MIPKPNPESSQARSRPAGHPPNSGPTRSASTAQARPDGFPFVAASASLLGHVVVIAILMNIPLRPPAPAPENKPISMRLLPSPAIEARLPADEDPPPGAQAPTEAVVPPPGDPIAEPSASAVAGAPPPADAAATDESTIEADPALSATLRADLLDQVRALPAATEGERRPVLPWTSSGEPISGVPGVRGWISGHVGSVTTSAHTWKDNDGASRGRYVLANGTVVCTRRRAPTIDELMNPWKSIAVTMGSICGRQRPDAPDFSDPRVQPPPSIAGKPPANGE